MSIASVLRIQIEAALADRIPSALTPTPRTTRLVESTGIRNIDELLHGGFPIAALTELVGAECSGRTSLALSFIAGLTRQNKVCAWVDVSNSLHPESAVRAGVDIRRLLWVRCGVPLISGIQSSSQSTFTLPQKYFNPRPVKKGLHGGGFGPHPRGEVKGLSNAIVGLLRPEAGGSQRDESQLRLKSEKGAVEPNYSQPIKELRKANLPGKPWSRLDQALRVTDLLLQNGGFGAIVLDMGSIAPEHVLRVPLATWFRYRAVAEQKQTTILLLTQHPCAKSSAGIQLHLQSSGTSPEESTVLAGVEHGIEVVRERFPPTATNVVSLRKPSQSKRYAHWQSRTTWTGR